MSKSPDRTVAVHVSDLQTLVDIAEGYICENGPEAVGRYADPTQLIRAITVVQDTIRKTGK